MEMRRVVGLALLVFFGCASGCGLFGRTRAKPIKTPEAVSAQLQLRAVRLEPAHTRLQNVGTFAIGEYKDRDVATLQETMQKTLGETAGHGSHRIHVVVRRFLVAHSNSAGLSVACVAWAITDASGKLVYHEQFYAADSVILWGTVGGTKNHVHEGITRHILTQASRLVSGQTPTRPGGEYVFATYEEAAATLPSSLTSVHVGMAGLGVGYVLTVSGTTDREWVRESEHLDWTKELAKTAS